MTIWTDSTTGNIIQSDANVYDAPVEIAGCTVSVLDAAAVAAFQTATAGPNGGVTFDGTKFVAKPVPQPVVSQAELDRKAAIAELKKSANADTQNLLKVLGL